MCLTPKEIVHAYIEASKKKANTSANTVILKAVLAGAMIALGASGSSVAAHNVENVGLARLIAACVFPVGLMMVILLGAELFTGDCLMSTALPNRDISGKQFAKTLTLVYIGNFIGAFFLSALVYYSGQLGYSGGLLGAYTIKVAVGKVSLDPATAFSSGILCNILVCAAVLMAMAAKDVAGKLLTSFFVIMLFVTSGFEHCVANMYYITAGLLAKENATYVQVAMQQYGLNVEKLANLNIINFFVKNLLPVTIGNIIGGSVCVGIAMFYACEIKEKNETTVQKKEGKNELHPNRVSSITR